MLLSRKHLPVSALLKSGMWKDSLMLASTEAPAAVNVEHCALLICHVLLTGQPPRRLGGRQGILKAHEVEGGLLRREGN